jgi:hypothetical protein
MDNVMVFYTAGMLLAILVNAVQAKKKAKSGGLEILQMVIYAGILMAYIAIFMNGSESLLKTFFIVTFIILLLLENLEIYLFAEKLTGGKNPNFLDVVSLLLSMGIVIAQVIVFLI